MNLYIHPPHIHPENKLYGVLIKCLPRTHVYSYYNYDQKRALKFIVLYLGPNNILIQSSLYYQPGLLFLKMVNFYFLGRAAHRVSLESLPEPEKFFSDSRLHKSEDKSC